jgi:hypothetical protein
MGDIGGIGPGSRASSWNASALSPLATNEPVRFGHCCWLRCCRIPGSAWLADVRACWLHDGRSRSPHQPPIPRDDPRRGQRPHQPLHPLGNPPRSPPKALSPLSAQEPKPWRSNSVSSYFLIAGVKKDPHGQTNGTKKDPIAVLANPIITSPSPISDRRSKKSACRARRVSA